MNVSETLYFIRTAHFRMNESYSVTTVSLTLIHLGLFMKYATMANKMYNKMTTKIKQLENFRRFKQRLKLFLLDNPFYSLNEFLYMKNTIDPIINNIKK
jgi:hypothetical protein